MNRRDTTLIAHLDAIEARWLTMVQGYHAEVMAEFRSLNERLDRIQQDIAGMKVDHATHQHGDES